MKVIVTGGCGLIGYHASMYYHNQGHEIVVIDNLERSSLLGHTEVSKDKEEFNKNKLEEIGIKVILMDVSQANTFKYLEARERFDLIIHLAGQCGVPTSIANPRRDMEINLIGTFNVLEYARKYGSTVLFASTNKIYPLKDDEFIFNEEHSRWVFRNKQWREKGFPIVQLPEDSRTPYGWSKYSADLLCQEYYHTYGVRTGVFRMSCIYGPNQYLNFSEQGWSVWFTVAINKGYPLTIYGDGFQIRDMLYMEDCVRAYDSFYKSNLQHGVFNLGGGPENTLSINECIKFLEQITGKKANISYSDWRSCDQKCYVSNIEETKQLLNWNPKVTPENGLIKVHKWALENLDLF